jgi:hypothetical protein
MMMSRGRQWSPNALEAKRKRRKDIIQIGGYDLLSKTWSREEREKQYRNKSREVERVNEALRGNRDNIEGKIEESAYEINDSTFTMTKRKYAMGQQNVGSPAKATRSHNTQGEEERQGRR